jgi:hypothetical protein
MSLIQIRTDATKAIQDYDIDLAFFNTSNMLALAKENIWKLIALAIISAHLFRL